MLSESTIFSFKSQKIFTFFCVLFATLLILSNFTVKVFSVPYFPKLTLTTGILLYPITFLITDTVTEIWGKKYAKYMILTGLCMNAILTLFLLFVVNVPVHSSWFVQNSPLGFQNIEEYQKAFHGVFSISLEVFIGSSVAYLVSQYLDVAIFLKIKEKTKGKYLWLRNNVSTLLSQLIDSLIMGFIVLIIGLKLDLMSSVSIISSEYLYKVVFTLIQTPFIYIFVNFIKNGLKAHVTPKLKNN